MSREIKFRMWNEITKTMMDLQKITPLAIDMDTDGLFIPFCGMPLMQFTGLRDRCSRPIFEGDIVDSYKEGKYEFRAIVEYDTVNPCFTLHRKPERYSSDYEYDFVLCDMRTLHVIGNIYENPELLSGT